MSETPPQQSQTATEPVETVQGIARQSPTPSEPAGTAQGGLGDDHRHTDRIREYANQVVHGDEWALSDINLSQVTFETRTKARRRHGVTQYEGGNYATVGISEHTIENAGFDAAKDTIRHELVHVWQYQHRGETVELPNGTTVEGVSPGHTGCWYEWEELMDVQRTNSHYSQPPNGYKYRIWCASCHQFIKGRHRMCKTVKHHSEHHRGWGWCGDCDGEGTDGNSFVVTDDDDEFYDNKRDHPSW